MSTRLGGEKSGRTDLLDFGDELGDTVMECGVELGGDAGSRRRRKKGIPRRRDPGAFRLMLTKHEVFWLIWNVYHFTTVSERNSGRRVRSVTQIFG